MKRLIDRLFGRKDESPRGLRNKAGGMAWVRIPAGVDWHKVGVFQINNAAVKTLGTNEAGNWRISPRLSFTATNDFTTPKGWFYRAGDSVGVTALADDYLEPWKDIPESDLIETDIDVPSSTKERA